MCSRDMRRYEQCPIDIHLAKEILGRWAHCQALQRAENMFSYSSMYPYRSYSGCSWSFAHSEHVTKFTIPELCVSSCIDWMHGTHTFLNNRASFLLPSHRNIFCWMNIDISLFDMRYAYSPTNRWCRSLQRKLIDEKKKVFWNFSTHIWF